MKRFGLFFSLSLMALVVLAACGGDDGDDNGNGNGNGGNGGGSVSIDMDADEFLFDPDSFSASPGDEVTVNLENVGDVFHDFVIDELDVDVELEPGDTDSANFTIPDDASGELEYYCSVPGHREAGMEGVIEIN